MKNVCASKNTITKVKRQHKEWGKISASCTSSRELVSGMSKYYTSTVNRQITPIKTWRRARALDTAPKTRHRHSLSRCQRVPLSSHSGNAAQTKMQYHFTPTKMALIITFFKKGNNEVGAGVRTSGPSHNAGRTSNGAAEEERSSAVLPKVKPKITI